MRIWLFLALTSGACAFTVMGSAEEVKASVCEHKGTNGMVTMLLCPDDLDAEDMAHEGQAVCGDRMPCGAWIWTNLSDMPTDPPDSHDKLTPAQVTSSKGVWMNELSQLVTIEPVQN